VRVRIADAVWELGKRLGTPTKGLYKHGRTAAELYFEAANGSHPPQSSFSMIELLTRGICLALHLKLPQLVECGFRRMVSFAETAELVQIGLWMAPFDRLIGLKGLSDSQRQEILDQCERRQQATIESRDLHGLVSA
jgi:hypothetical protein